MKTLKNIVRFAALTMTTGITIFFFMILLCKTDLIIAMMVSKPVLFLLGLTVGAIIGLIVGVTATTLRFMKEFEHKDKVIEIQTNKANQLQNKLDEAEAIVKRLIRPLAEERTRKNNQRGQEIISQISDLSDEDDTKAPQENLSTDKT